jgi:regulator of cell morphogenesis and NO signaling
MVFFSEKFYICHEQISPSKKPYILSVNANIEQVKVGGLVNKYPQLANIFDEYRIDFCRGGGVSLAHAAGKKKVDLEALVSKVKTELGNDTAHMPDETWSSKALVDHIVDNHHQYVSREIPLLLKFLNKLEKVHGERHPELFEIHRLFTASAADLTAHMKKEELVAFPLIERLEKVANGDIEISAEHQERLMESIGELVSEHENEGDRFGKIAELTNNFVPPADACNTYMVTFHKLAAFERDLHQHIHLENNILFKKAVRDLAELD